MLILRINQGLMVFGIIGLGGVGILLAHFLNNAGYVPYVVTRTHYGRYIIRFGEEHEVRVKLVDKLPSGVKYTLIAVKAYDTESIIDKVVNTPVAFQNGIGNVELIRERLGIGYGAVITYGITRSGGVAEVRGVGEVILPSSVGEVADVLKAGGANVRVVDDIEPYRWLKVIINAAINPITAILRARNGVILEDPNARALVGAVVMEGVDVVNRLGIGLPSDPLAETLRVAEATRDNQSSMLQDVLNRRRTEVDYVNGAIVTRGREVGVSTPVNYVLWLLVKSLEVSTYK
ncbi:ketopantoate reductase family protein [Vulcanisaeta souniana]|uniref:2-dehydropantoate 2-reductase n=2 Tax=Vulcanisaeta souniana JCM 11219 TaxID=1293586 RepID=A0ABM8BQD5_9CREN|nr:2-dehydropantoate 2-reductase [Vulcanisaeta souniana]BDR93239.1 2-dehydropantoate 2-reductase [Vulcanisaeta souniana JCM 11219]